MQTEKGLALQDIITQLHILVLTIQLPSESKAYLLEQLSDIEARLSSSGSEKMNLGATVGCFQLVRELLTREE